MGGRRPPSVEMEWVISGVGMERERQNLTRAPAHPRTTAASLARGAPAERLCCVTEMASGAPRTAESLHVHHCGSIRRENASHDDFHLSPLHSEQSTSPAWNGLCTFEGMRLDFTTPPGQRAMPGLRAGHTHCRYTGISPKAQVAQPRGPTEEASRTATITDRCRNCFDAAVGNCSTKCNEV